MVFANNTLTLNHKSGLSVDFNALDALRKVSNGKQTIKVAHSDTWKDSR